MINDLSAFSPGQQFPPSDTDERKRVRRYQTNILLYRNEHEEDAAFGQSRRTLRPELAVAHKMILGYHERLTTHWHDLVFGENPVMLVGSGPADAETVNFVRDINLMEAAREVIIDVSALGDGLFKVRPLGNGRVVVESQQPEAWYPVVRVNDIREVTAHVLAWTFSIKTELGLLERVAQSRRASEQKFLQLEIHEPGRITTRVHRLDDGTIGQDVTEQFENVVPLVTLDTNEFLLVHVPNKRTSRDLYGTDDYEKLDTIIMEMEDRLSQMSRVLDKHVDPTVFGPTSALTYNSDSGLWEFKTKGYIAMNDRDDPIPGYLAWDGKLEAALSQFNLLFNQLLLLSETSPAGFGMFGEVPPVESGIALKRLLRTDLAKAVRLQTAFSAAFERVLSIAAGLSGQEERLPESFSWMFRDGLPDDPNENSQIAERSLREGFMSVRTAVKMLHPDWTEDQVDQEMLRIEGDKEAAVERMPNFGSGGSNDGNDSSQATPSSNGVSA